MPIKTWLYSFFVLAGAAVGGKLCWSSHSIADLMPARREVPRKIASFHPDSNRISKPNPTVDVTIEAVDGFPASNNQVARLRATIALHRNFDEDVSLKWVLPVGVELVSGELEGNLTGLRAGQSITREISVQGFSSEGVPRNVMVEVAGNLSRTAVGTSAVFSSHPTRSDLSIGFRKGHSQTGSESQGQAKVQGDDDVESTKPLLPKGIRL